MYQEMVCQIFFLKTSQQPSLLKLQQLCHRKLLKIKEEKEKNTLNTSLVA
jgi:hypothetical protein